MQKNVLVEVCCGSADDAARAYAVGADRVELNCALDAGGLTPSLGLLRATLEHAKLPVICMVRPRAGGFCYTALEYAAMVEDAKRLMDAGAAGLAFGVLRADGSIDVERCAGLIRAAGGGEMVFHRAFDVLREEPETAVDTLAALGFCRVLSSGRAPVALDGADVLRRCVKRAGGRLQILAGGGVRPHNAAALLEKSGVGQLHFTCHTLWQDSSAAGAQVSFDGPGMPPCGVRIVDTEALGAFIRQLHGLKKAW